MADIFAALWLGDSVGSFLTLGGDIYYHSPIQPEPLRPGCHGWSTYGNFVADENLNIRAHTAQYYASQMINLEWVKHHGGNHRLFAASADLKDGAGHTLITAYPLQLPDGQWSLMIVNKDQTNPHRIHVLFDDGTAPGKSFSGSISMVTFGSEQYVWRSEAINSHPDPNNPPTRRSVQGSVIELPKASLTVLARNCRRLHQVKIIAGGFMYELPEAVADPSVRRAGFPFRGADRSRRHHP